MTVQKVLKGSCQNSMNVTVKKTLSVWTKYGGNTGTGNTEIRGQTGRSPIFVAEILGSVPSVPRFFSLCVKDFGFEY